MNDPLKPDDELSRLPWAFIWLFMLLLTVIFLTAGFNAMV